MKKLLALLMLAAVMIGCSGSETAADATGTDAKATAPAEAGGAGPSGGAAGAALPPPPN